MNTNSLTYLLIQFDTQITIQPLKSKLQVLIMLSVLPNDTRLGGLTSTGSHSSSACRCLRLCSACFHNRHEMSCTQSRRTCADVLRSVYVEPGRRLRNHNSNASPVSPAFSVRPTSDVYSCTVIRKTSAHYNILG